MRKFFSTSVSTGAFELFAYTYIKNNTHAFLGNFRCKKGAIYTNVLLGHS